MIPLCKQNKVVVTDISNTKTDKVTEVTRALDYKIGKMHFINILCYVQNTTSAYNLFNTGIKPYQLTELCCSNFNRVYRAVMGTEGQIQITSASITNKTLINIFGVVIEK